MVLPVCFLLLRFLRLLSKRFVGGEEDGVDNTGADNDDLYSKPEEVWEVYKAMSAVGPMFTVAAAFGNVHGVYKPGNVVLKPGL